MHDLTDPKRQTHKSKRQTHKTIWTLKAFCEVCSSAPLRTVQRVFGPKDNLWLDHRPNPLGGKPMVGGQVNSVSAKWAANEAKTSKGATKAATMRWWKISGND